VDGVEHLPDLPLFLLANEFFDALPVRQFLRDDEGWRERLVWGDDDQLRFGLGPPAELAALEGRSAARGEMVETCAPAEALAGEVARRIAAHGGAALILDYGDWSVPGDTLQAVRRHRKVGVLEAPGECDLTAHVDFAALARAAAATGALAGPMVPQGAFLERLGITARAHQLLRGKPPETAAALAAAHRRLTHPEEMGHLFKAMAIHPQTAPTPPGFA
jgi:SAM-dependent MidA family methyltransferase